MASKAVVCCRDAPTAFAPAIQRHPIQTPAGVRLEIPHHPLRRHLRADHRVHVITSHMRRQQAPTAMCTRLLNRLQHSAAADLIQVVGSLIHSFRLGRYPRGSGFQDRGPVHIVRAVYGAGFGAVQVASVAGKGDQVGHWMCQFYRSLTVAALTRVFVERSELPTCPTKIFSPLSKIGRKPPICKMSLPRNGTRWGNL